MKNVRVCILSQAVKNVQFAQRLLTLLFKLMKHHTDTSIYRSLFPGSPICRFFLWNVTTNYFAENLLVHLSSKMNY